MQKAKTTTLKTCFRCHKTKDISEFYRTPNSNDGFLGKCKACFKIDHTNAWTPEQDEYIRQWFLVLTTKEMALKLNRTENAVEARRAHLQCDKYTVLRPFVSDPKLLEMKALVYFIENTEYPLWKEIAKRRLKDIESTFKV